MSQTYNSVGDHAVTLSFSGTTAHTIMSWIYPTSGTDGGDAVTLWDGTYTNSSVIGFNGSGGLTTYVQNGASSYTSPAQSYSTNTWVHFASVFDGSNVISYVNGVQVDTHAFSLSGRATLTQLQIGMGGVARQQQDVLLFTSALTAAQVIECMRARVPLAARASLHGQWPLYNDRPLLDFSGNGRTLSNNSGTPTAGTTWAPTSWTQRDVRRPIGPQYVASGISLAGSLNSGSTLAGTLLQSVPLAGTESVASTLAATLSVPKNLAGGSTVASTFSAALSVAVALTGSTTSATTLAATLTQAQPLVGSETVASTLSATLTQAQPLVGSTTSASTLAGTLTVPKPLAGSSSVASTLAASLQVATALAGSETVASTFAGTLDVPKNLQGSDTSASTLAATLSQAQPLVGSTTSASTLGATLDVTKPLAGSTTSASTFSATLGITGLFQGASTVASTLSGTLGVLRPIAGSETVASTLAGTLSQAQPLAASSTVASTLAAALTVPKGLAGSDTSASTLSGTLTLSQPLVGTESVASTLAGTLTVPKPLTATSSVASTLSATLTTQNILAGSMASSSQLRGTISGGTPYFPPVWAVWAGWSDGGDVADATTDAGPWVPSGVEWTGELHGAWASDGEGDMAGHGKWSEDPVSGGTVLYPERWRALRGTMRSASSARGVLALGPQPILLGLMPGGAFGMVKDWQFGSSKTLNNAAALNTEFTYHDPFGTISNGTNYGALIQRAAGAPTFSVYNWGDIGMADDQQPEDTTGRYRTWTSTTMQAHVKPLNTGSTIVGPASTHNAGCGSLVSKYTLPAGGARLGKDIVWETRVRILNAPLGYWFALWIVGPSWDGGPEIDAIEAFSSSSPNINGDLFNANGIGTGSNSKDYFSGGWDTVLSTLGIPGYAIPNGSQSLRNWHTFTMYYAKNNAFTLYMDSTVIQSGTLDWKVPTGSTVPPLSFLFDFGFGHTGISPINSTVISDITATPLTYEIDYSRVWLR